MSPSNLPDQWTSFVGRKQELADLKGIIADSRLVTITGAGECGKTRLALQVAKARESYYPDGVWLVNLTLTRDPAHIPQMITQAIGLHLPADQPAMDHLLQWISPKQMLLVLDNCEHLLEACAGLIQSILSQSGNLYILTTSRQPLSISGEVIYPLAGLNVSPPKANLDHPQRDILLYSSLLLYLDRVRAILPGFNITSENISAIVKICQQLDGLPLALELASARSNMLTPQQICDRLGDRFTFLISKRRDSEENHRQTLSATIDWSYDLLSLPEQTLFSQLAVFAPGFTLTTVEMISAGDEVDRMEVLDLLSSLANQSLLVSHTLNRSEARYSMLETIRQYAQAKLIASGEWEMMHDRHLDCFLKIAEESETNLTGPYQRIWLDWLEEFNENIRVALSWSIGNAGERSEIHNRRVEARLRIAIAIYQFWVIRDHVEEGLNWCEQLLAQAGNGVPVHIRANVFAYASFLAGLRRREADQIRYSDNAVAHANQAGEQGKAALKWALYAQYYAARAAGDHQAEYEQGLRLIKLNREFGDRYQLGLMLTFTSFSAMTIGAYEPAQEMIMEALALLR